MVTTRRSGADPNTTPPASTLNTWQTRAASTKTSARGGADKASPGGSLTKASAHVAADSDEDEADSEPLAKKRKTKRVVVVSDDDDDEDDSATALVPAVVQAAPVVAIDLATCACPNSLRELLFMMMSVLLPHTAETVYNDALDELTPDFLADFFVGHMASTSQAAFQYVDQCVQARKAWTLDQVVSLLPSSAGYRREHGIYMIKVEHKRPQRQTRTHGYGGSVFGLTRNLAARVMNEHLNVSYRAGHKSKPLYRLIDEANVQVATSQGALLAFSKLESAKYGPGLALLLETAAVELFCGWDSQLKLDKLPELLPRSFVVAIAGSSVGNVSKLSSRSILQKVLGCDGTNNRIPAHERFPHRSKSAAAPAKPSSLVSVKASASKPSKSVSASASALASASAPQAAVRPIYEKAILSRLIACQGATEHKMNKQCQMWLSPERAFSLSEEQRLRMEARGFSGGRKSNRPYVEIRVYKTDTFNAENYAGVSQDFSRPELPDVGCIMFELTWLDAQANAQSMNLLAPTSGAKLGVNNRRMRSAVFAQSLYELIDGTLPPPQGQDFGEWRDDLRVSTSAQDSKVFDDDDLCTKVFDLAQYKEKDQHMCLGCNTGPRGFGAHIIHLGLKPRTGRAWNAAQLQQQQACLLNGYDGPSTDVIYVADAHGLNKRSHVQIMANYRQGPNIRAPE